MKHTGENSAFDYVLLRACQSFLSSHCAQSWRMIAQSWRKITRVVAQNKRPMAFMDIMEMRQATAPVVSPDGRWALYTLNTPDWKSGQELYGYLPCRP